MPESSTGPQGDPQARDHLFISYAWEDGVLAEWLALKLTALGYKVWCDRFKLLGGESYPRNIDEAIKTRTFRMLALLSKHSIQKANPLKERTLALILGRERREDFVIPLNVDGLPPTALDWMVSDLTFIPFGSWSDGLTALLRKLEDINAPAASTAGTGSVQAWLDAGLALREVPERLWSNLIPITVPDVLKRLTLRTEGGGEWPNGVGRYLESERVVWSFVEPPGMRFSNVESTLWRSDRRTFKGATPSDIVTRLLNDQLDKLCASRGLVRAPAGDWYFAGGTIPSGRLSFTSYTGRPTYTKVIGERKFWSGRRPERSRYHLSFILRPRLFDFVRPIVLVRPRVFLTELSGEQMDHKKLARRRKALCKSWFNHHWLCRVLAISEFLAGGSSDGVALAAEWCPELRLASRPLEFQSPVSIIEDGDSEADDDDEDERDIAEEDGPSEHDTEDDDS